MEEGGGCVEVPNKRIIEAKRGYLKRGEVKRGYRRAFLGQIRVSLKTGFSMPLFRAVTGSNLSFFRNTLKMGVFRATVGPF